MGPIGQLVGDDPGHGRHGQGRPGRGRPRRPQADRGDHPLDDAATSAATRRVLNGSRRRRIAAGSGTSLTEVNRLVKQFAEMQTLMKQLAGRPRTRPARRHADRAAMRGT